MNDSVQTLDAPTPQIAVAIPSQGRTVADLMKPAVGVFAPGLTVAQATEQLRENVKTAFITYLYIVDPAGKLIGLVVMREMLLAAHQDRLHHLSLHRRSGGQADRPRRHARDAVGGARGHARIDHAARAFCAQVRHAARRGAAAGAGEAFPGLSGG